jgi:hypothetical protein
LEAGRCSEMSGEAKSLLGPAPLERVAAAIVRAEDLDRRIRRVKSTIELRKSVLPAARPGSQSGESGEADQELCMSSTLRGRHCGSGPLTMADAYPRTLCASPVPLDPGAWHGAKRDAGQRTVHQHTPSHQQHDELLHRLDGHDGLLGRHDRDAARLACAQARTGRLDDARGAHGAADGPGRQPGSAADVGRAAAALQVARHPWPPGSQNVCCCGVGAGAGDGGGRAGSLDGRPAWISKQLRPVAQLACGGERGAGAWRLRCGHGHMRFE